MPESCCRSLLSNCFHPCNAIVFQVVGPTNELVEAKLQLKVETQRIFSQMTLKASALSESLPTRSSIYVFFFSRPTYEYFRAAAPGLDTYSRMVGVLSILLLRGTIVSRTYGIHKNLYI